MRSVTIFHLEFSSLGVLRALDLSDDLRGGLWIFFFSKITSLKSVHTKERDEACLVSSLISLNISKRGSVGSLCSEV